MVVLKLSPLLSPHLETARSGHLLTLLRETAMLLALKCWPSEVLRRH